MKLIENQRFDEERALYESDGVTVIECKFDGEADGESAFKESRNIVAEKCFFNLRYPFWHDDKVSLLDCEMTSLCRAPFWYTSDVHIKDSILHGVKAFRECEGVEINNSDIVSTEFGWSTKNITINGGSAEGEYFMLRAENVKLLDMHFKGKYSFQYVSDVVIENCELDTKDAFWHSKNVTVRNSIVKGEYLAWYSENLTLENCTIIGTQPLCYCKGLKLINCEMKDADLAFERSEVEATVTSEVISIKNAYSGSISVRSVGEIIKSDDRFKCEIKVLS
ncbi:MAG: DUF3737 family protein [Clostridia bacterium]|nr:DUF3737 family protein [Clostridia bacterium]